MAQSPWGRPPTPRGQEARRSATGSRGHPWARVVALRGPWAWQWGGAWGDFAVGRLEGQGWTW